MSDRSFFYAFPRLYKIGMKIIPGKKYDEKYQCIADSIGNSNNILEPACGPALLPFFLDNDNKYRGFDINEKFVQYAQKKGFDVWLGDAMNPESYLHSDVVVLCDALHHIGIENEVFFIKNAMQVAKKQLILCEPFKDTYLSILPDWLPGGKKILNWWYDLIEKDGSNKVKLEHVRTKEELRKLMMDGYGVIPDTAKRDLFEIGENFIITYYL